MQVKTQQLLLCSGDQVNDNMFRPFYLFQLGHHLISFVIPTIAHTAETNHLQIKKISGHLSDFNKNLNGLTFACIA
jgi:hypothetical protein